MLLLTLMQWCSKSEKVNILVIIPAPSQNTMTQLKKGASNDLMCRRREIPALVVKNPLKNRKYNFEFGIDFIVSECLYSIEIENYTP